MIFLIEYDRYRRQVLAIERFQNEERHAAQESRIQWEVAATTRPDTEIVLLEAQEEGIVRKTHARYFEDGDSMSLGDLLEQAKNRPF